MSMKPKRDRIQCGSGQDCVQFNGFVQQTIGSYESFTFALSGIVNIKFSGVIRIRKALGFGFLRSITIYTIMFSSSLALGSLRKDLDSSTAYGNSRPKATRR